MGIISFSVSAMQILLLDTPGSSGLLLFRVTFLQEEEVQERRLGCTTSSLITA